MKLDKREILFRGKDLHTNQWHYGFPYITEHGLAYIQAQKPGEAFQHWQVKPETITEYTGVRDSTTWEDLTEVERDKWVKSGNLPSHWKGNQIFEGDIVYIYENMLIKFENGSFYGHWKTGFRYPLSQYSLFECFSNPMHSRHVMSPHILPVDNMSKMDFCWLHQLFHHQ